MSDRGATATASQETRLAVAGKTGPLVVPADLEENAEDRRGAEDGRGLGSCAKLGSLAFL